jgi:hypothetical protein
MRPSILGRFPAFCRLLVALTLSPLMLAATQASAQQANNDQYTAQEIVDAGHSFFGSTSGGLAKVIETAFQKYGLPNGYILGQEGSGAFIAGLTYGEGQLNTKNAGEHPLYWQGPSLGIDYGGQGTRVMMLVYDLPSNRRDLRPFRRRQRPGVRDCRLRHDIAQEQQRACGADPHRCRRPPRP